MLIIEHTQAPHVVKRMWRAPYHAPARKQQPFTIRITHIQTTVKRNEFRKSKDDHEPMIFEVNVSAVCQETQLRVYFKHTLQFLRYVDSWQIKDSFDREESDFVRIQEGMSCNEIYIKIVQGEIIRIKALAEERLSRNGSPYLNLTRVQRVHEDTLL